ncbi:MAG: 8-oxo-dGTP diphosphatase [Lachnospiraceae bacterium]|nr:8-oxo-dGTP diphosphatase [Lachnospiraceae bacterium]
MKREITTLCYLERDECYLMLHRIKKENDINKGKWIGIGGHIEGTETPGECLIRETMEETGLTLHSFRYRGIITFVYGDVLEYMFLFTSNDFSGDLKECDEGILQWVPIKDIPDLALWEGDRIFLKLLWENADFFSLKLVYDKNGNLVESLLE